MNNVKLPKNDKVNLKSFCNVLDLKVMTNSYKIYWFFAIFEEIKKGNKRITFEKIVYRMIAKSWYSIIEFKLNFGLKDQLDGIVKYIYKNHIFDKNIKEEKLIEELSELDDVELNKKMKLLFNYVPYRLLTPFFPELQGVKDGKRNKLIVELSNKNDKGIYKINEMEKEIIIHENWFEYLYENQVIIEGWLMSKLIFFLQTKNRNIPAIPFKIYAPQKRNLTLATNFWKKIITINGAKDIYTGVDLKENISIDHFIPWSFVLHDELWNLVPTTREINSSKNDKLPDLDIFLNKFCEMQYMGLKTALNNNFRKKEIEDYITIMKDMDYKKDFPKRHFIENLQDTIIPVYQIAKNQGFLLWNKII